MVFRQLTPGNGCKTYLVGREGEKRVALIDPALDRLDDYKRLLAENGWTLAHVVDTHTHADHLSAGKSLKEATGCEYVMHKAAPADCVTVRVDEGHAIDLSGVTARVIFTPGHTQDSISLRIDDRLLTGDVLFLDEGGAGRTDLPGGNPAEHWDSLQRILTLPGNVIVYPGHEYRGKPPSNLNLQKRLNPFLAPRSKPDYLRFVEDLRLGPADWMKDVLKANYACEMNPAAVAIPTEGAACEVQLPGSMAALGARGGRMEVGVAEMSPFDLRKKMDAGEPIVLLDVRELHELTEEYGHLPGIVHIPVGLLTHRLPELDHAREKEIVVVCRTGRRATAVAALMSQTGFTKPVVLAGGMHAWCRAGFPSLDRA